MRRVIREIRNSRHGGTIVFAPRLLMENLLKSGGPLRAKYRIEETCTASPFALILEEVTRRLAQFAWLKENRRPAGRSIWHGTMSFRIPSASALWNWLCGFQTSRRSTVACFSTTNSPSSDLASKFRSRVLKTKWCIAPSISKRQDCVLESMESAGTRHRTAYRLCREYAHCLAIVVSQDGAVKFVANHQDKVTYWNHLDFN